MALAMLVWWMAASGNWAVANWVRMQYGARLDFGECLMPPTASRFRESIFNDFRNAVGVNADGFGFAKVNEQMVILRRADISGFLEKILFAIVEPDAKGTKRTPLNQILNFLNFHQ